MDDLKGRPLETAVRPFAGDPEIQLAASQLLGEQVRPDGRGAEEAIARWNEVDARTRRPRWKIGLFSLWVIISAVVWTDGVRAVVNRQRFFGSEITDIFYSGRGSSPEKVTRNLTDRQQLLLYGDSPEGRKPEQAKALWDSDPTNPAYFAEYVNVFLSTNADTLPPDFLETAGRIDPENAWFTYVAAGVKAKDAVKKKKQSKPEIAANKTPEWDILDPKKLADVLAILR